MTQIDFTQNERIERLRRFGYTEREAAFLCLAGLHSGYFLRRQYVRFLGARVGGTAAALIEKALAREHVRTCTYVANAHIYHLCARPFYAAIGQEDNRNRRDRQPLTIKTKLMGLDYVLEHPSHRYLATEQEKVRHFTDFLNVSPEALPAVRFQSPAGGAATVRYFVDKYPIYTGHSPHGNGSDVTFCYVDAGATTVSGFETHLHRYAPLFQSMPCVQVVYVATRPLAFEPAQRVFDRFARQIGNPNLPATSIPTVHRDYFAARFRYEQNDLASFDRAALIRLRDQRRRFSAADIESDYQRWRAGRDTPTRNAAQATIHATFSTCVLEQNYDVFGTLTTI